MTARNVNQVVADSVLSQLLGDPDALVEIAYGEDTGTPTKARMASRIAAHIERRVKDILAGDVGDDDMLRSIIRASGLRVAEVREYVDLDGLVRRAEQEEKKLSAAR